MVDDSETFTLVAVTPENIDQYWWKEFVLPRLESALKRSGNRETTEQVKEAIISGDKQMWVVDGYGFAITRITMNHLLDESILWIHYLGGERIREWLALILVFFDRLAVRKNCSRIKVQGRPGWRKMIKTWGYSVQSVNFEKDLTNGR